MARPAWACLSRIPGQKFSVAPATLERDGFASQVKLSDDDLLCLNGQKMVLSSGNYGKNGAVYLVDFNPGTFVTQTNDLSDADCQFMVLTQGLTSKVYTSSLPKDNVSNLENPNILRWRISTRISPEQKITSFSYRSISANEIVLSEIRYNGSIATDGTINPGKQSVILHYESRPDIESTFLYGQESRQTRRIKEIQFGEYDEASMKFFNKLSFKLSYQLSRSTQRSLLIEVSRCSLADHFSCNKLARFDWLNEKVEYSAPILLAENLTNDEVKPQNNDKQLIDIQAIGDMDGDGRVDLLYTYSNKSQDIAFIDHTNSTRTIILPPEFQLPSKQVNFPSHGDLKHVGGSDLLGKVGDNFALVSVRESKPTKPMIFNIPYSNDHLITDIDNDGRSDLVVASKKSNDFIVEWFRNKNPRESSVKFDAPIEIINIPFRKGMRLNPRNDVSGLASLVISSDFGIEGIAMFDTTKTGALKSEIVRAAELGIHKLAAKSGTWADINGDGLADLVYLDESAHWAIQLNTGHGFAPTRATKVLDARQTPTAITGTIVVDFDSDGKDELVFPDETLLDSAVQSESKIKDQSKFNSGSYRFSAISFVSLSDGAITATVRKLSLVAPANHVLAADIHGDGYKDFVSIFNLEPDDGTLLTRKDERVSCPPQHACEPKIVSPMHMQNGSTQDSPLDTVKSFHADKTTSTWTYHTLAEAMEPLYSVPDLGSKERQLGENDFFFRSSMPVVSEFQVQGPEQTVHERFSYGAATYNSGGFGSNGHRWIAIEDVPRKTRSVYFFRQSFPFTGSQIRQWLELVDDTEHDYLNGSPGRDYRHVIDFDQECFGPQGHSASLRFGCKPATAFAIFPVDLGKQSTPYVSEQEFKRLNTPPPNLDAIRKAWQRVSKAYNQLGSQGFAAKVTLTDIDGNATHGVDEYILGKLPTIRELRSDRETIAVGPRFCTRSPLTAPWKCANSEINGEHLHVNWDAVVEAKITEEQCAQERCLRMVILSSDSVGDDTLVFSTDPMRAGHRYTLVAKLDDARPLSFEEETIFLLENAFGVGHFTAAYTYDFTAGKPTIKLPE